MAGDTRVGMTVRKRIFDVLVAVALSVILLPVIGILAVWMIFRQGLPVFYVSERMKTPDQSFKLVKFRTMRTTEPVNNTGVSGGDKTDRITKTGRFLRRTRLDEVPQLWNVLRGDISFVGPRPPLRQYTEKFPQIYHDVLRSRPGITGLATLKYHRFEEALLAECTTPEETEDVYCRRCVPRKAAIDLIYQRHQSLCLDVKLMVQTAWRAIRR